AEMDAEAIQNPLLLGQRRVASDHALLNDDGAAHRFDRAVEHRQETVAGMFDQLAVMLGDGWLDQVAFLSLDSRVRAFLVHPHQTAIAGDVRREDRSETTNRPVDARDLIPAATKLVNATARLVGVTHFNRRHIRQTRGDNASDWWVWQVLVVDMY